MNIQRSLDRLNPEQRKAVIHKKGPLLILAGAGSGKTSVITTRAAYLISEGVDAGSVLAVTFTNKAAKEMRERVRSMLKKRNGTNPFISTFHSLCLNILRQEIEHLGYRKDFSIYDTSDQISLLRNILSDIRVQDRSFKPESVMEKISLTKNSHRPSKLLGDKDDDLEMISELVYPKYREALRSLNALDFDDLLLLTIELFRNHHSILDKYRDRFEYIMVDEYQDTNRVQYELIKLLAGKRKNLCVVGDDDQSIYGWRGAHIGNILDFERDFPGTVVIRLEQNYRSFGNILGVANSVIVNNKKRMEKSLWTENGTGPKVSVFRAPDGEREAEWVAGRIEEMKYDRNNPYEDFAVIYRANLFSRPFEEALRKKRIPYTVIGGTSYFEHREIKDLAAYLKLMANTRDDMSLLRAANVPKRGLGPTALGKLAEFARQNGLSLFEAFAKAGEIFELNEKAASSARNFASLIQKYRDRFKGGRDMARSFESLIEEINYRDYVQEIFKSPEAALRRIESLDAFISSIAYYEDNETSPSLHGFLETLALTDMSDDKKETSRGGVTLISFHSSKGLEFPVVFIVGVEEDILPHKKSGGEIEEERRLFYVGITRAMKKLYISHTDHRIKYGKETPSSPSRFLNEIPEDIVTRSSWLTREEPEDEERDAGSFFARIRTMLGD